MQLKYTLGIDEVGRGPIAGPVAVGVFVFLNSRSVKIFKGVKESKQLSESKREEWFKKIQIAKKDKIIDFHVVFQSEKIIDTKGLSFAINNALRLAIKKTKLNPKEVKVLLDGGLKAPKEFTNQKTIIKGDAKEMSIALASICAKVLRDRKMRQWSIKYPNYSFEINKGYGTRAHYEAIKKHGLTPLHRRSFLKKLQ